MDRRSFCKQFALAQLAIGGALLCPKMAHSLIALPEHHRQVRYVMGTLLDISVYTSDEAAAKAFFQEAFAQVDTLDRELSNYKATSEISRLNSGEKVNLSESTKAVLALGRKFEQGTNGSFNIGVKPLISLWKQAEQSQKVPSEKQIKTAKAVSTTDVISNNGDSYFLEHPSAAIDTGGIGKGYAVEKIRPLLKKYSIDSALINFGHSTIYAHGKPPTGEHWNLELRFPDENSRGVLRLKDEAASASSAFGSSYLIKEQKYGHILDPKSGYPIQKKNLVAVTSKSALDAEILSSSTILSDDTLPKNMSLLGLYHEHVGNVETRGLFRLT